MKTLLSILLLTTSFCFSQTGFIEIEVRDTIRIKPDTFEYHLNVNQSSIMEGSDSESYDPKATNEKLKVKLKELETFLTKKAYDFKPMYNSTYELNNNSYFSKNGYVVTFASSKGLQKLMNDLKALDYVKGSLGEFHYTNQEKAEESLFKKLLEKARKKAMTIAKLSDLSLGKIIEFREAKEVDNLTFSMLDMYAVTQFNKKWGSAKNELFGQKSKAIIVKFLAE